MWRGWWLGLGNGAGAVCDGCGCNCRRRSGVAGGGLAQREHAAACSAGVGLCPDLHTRSPPPLPHRLPASPPQVSDKMDPSELVALIATLNPENTPGRLAVIVRMGAAKLREKLPTLIGAVQQVGGLD